MFKTILLPTTLAFVTLAPLSAHSASQFENIALAKQCHFVAEKISSLSESQSEDTCEFILDNAVYDAEFAGNSILNEEYSEAKRHLKNSMRELNYAQTLVCINSVEIGLAKNELLQIDAKVKGLDSSS
jgi:hypothetical protein